ncbi:hypothetical protein CNY67_05700 [Desulfovibrio sp. G11]|nr:hypothetical protein CNY67_05700 [Desulfovibrio sp. G11]
MVFSFAWDKMPNLHFLHISKTRIPTAQIRFDVYILLKHTSFKRYAEMMHSGGAPACQAAVTNLSVLPRGVLPIFQ